MPRRLCVVNGPFIGGNDGSIAIRLEIEAERIVVGAVIVPSGLPRSQARSSLSPKTWQLAHAESPCELRVAS